MRSYYNWVAMGLRLGVTENLVRIAKDRESSIAELAKKGQLAPIVKVDNERLVISRQLTAVQARRRFEAASIELSLFYRDTNDDPVVITRHHLPDRFPKASMPIESKVGQATTTAFALRPELLRIRLVQEKFGIDRQLAKNNLMPNIDLTASVSENLGTGPYKDRKQTESSIGLEFRLPLQRNEAQGRLQTIDAELERLSNDAKFARERIVAEIRDAWSATKAAHEQIGQTSRNVELAVQLEQAEAKRLEQGATDLLALQIREQATFDGRLLEVDAQAEYFRAQADYEAATATKLLNWKSALTQKPRSN